jgi:hypothetical protein
VVLREDQMKKISAYAGWNWNGFGIGFHFDKWHFSLDLGFAWISFEW